MFCGRQIVLEVGFHTDSSELPYECWELNPSPLEEQLVLLTTEPSFQADFKIYFISIVFLICECKNMSVSECPMCVGAHGCQEMSDSL